MRILIADDHAVVRQGLMLILTRALGPAEFGEAADSRQTIAAALKQPWDLLILDLSMPGRNGLEVLKELRAGAGEAPPAARAERSWRGGASPRRAERRPLRRRRRCCRLRRAARPQDGWAAREHWPRPPPARSRDGPAASRRRVATERRLRPARSSSRRCAWSRPRRYGRRSATPSWRRAKPPCGRP